MSTTCIRLFRQAIVPAVWSLLFSAFFSAYTVAAAGEEANGGRQTPSANVIVTNEVYAPAEGADKTVYVSPDGSDETGDGSIGSPYRTIVKARDDVRAYLAATPAGDRGDVTVYLRGGTYFLADTLVLGPEDSGTGDHTIVYAAYPGETPIVSGGQPITGWEPAGNGIYKAPVGTLDFRQLYIDGERGVRARTPNAGSYYRLKSFNNADKTISVNAAEAAGLQGGAGRPEMIIQTHWADRHMMIDGVQIGTTEAKLTPAEPEAGQVIGNEAPKSEPGQSYHFENKLAFLDEAGEWFLDTDNGELYYKPLPGQDMSAAEAIAPRLETIVKLAGTADNPVHDIEFRGLTFEHSNWLKPNDGYAAVQATYYMVDGLWYGGKLPGAVQLESAGDVRFERNTFRNLGATGLDLTAGNFDDTIEGNVFTEISGNGVAVASRLHTVPTIPTDPRMIDQRITVDNNFISKVGRDYYGAVGIFAGFVHELSVLHNEITDTPYSGMSIGWGFTKTETPLRNNLIAYNRIWNVMNLMDDGGGIYTLSYQPGTVIKENYISDVLRSPWTTNNYPDTEWWRNLGIYLDNSSSGMTVTNNVILNAERTIKTNVAPYGTSTFIRNHNDLQPVKDNAGLEAAFGDIRLAAPTDPPPAAPDVTAPQLLTAVVDDPGTHMTLKFDEPLEAVSDTGELDASDFALSGTAATVSSAVMDYADYNNATVTLTLNEPVGFGKTVTLSMAEGAVRDVALNSLAAASGFAVNNQMLMPYLMKMTMDGSPVLHAGESAQIHASLTTRDGGPVPVGSAEQPVFASENGAVATVGSADGVVTAVAAGETGINVSIAIDDGINALTVTEPVHIQVVPPSEPKPELINISAGRNATATSQYSASYAAGKAVDNNINTAWITAGTGSLTIDLGAQADLYRIRKLEVVTRQDADQASTRRNFAIYGASDEKFTNPVLLGQQGNTSVDFRSTWTADVADSPSLRYIRFDKTVDFAAVAELRVLAEPVSPPAEISNLSVITDDGKLEAAWDEAGGDDMAAVDIYEGGPTEGGTLVKTVAAGVGTAELTGLANGTPQTFTIKTADAAGHHSFGRTVTATPQQPANIALGKPVTATGETSGADSADKAVDGNEASNWVTTGPATLTVDLGADYGNSVIRRVEMVSRQDANDPQTRRRFEVWASNDPSFATYTVLGSQGNAPLHKYATWSADVAGSESYRYVRFVKPDQHAAVAELRVMASPIAAPDDIYDAKSYTEDGQLVLAWKEHPDSLLAGIRIYNGETLVQSVDAGVGQAALTGLTNGTPYTFTIKAIGGRGNESAGVDATGTPAKLTNIALTASATATSEYSASYAAAKVRDNNTGTAWVTAGTASLTLDLGESYDQYRIRKIEAVTRLDADQASSRRNFEVWASNDPDFATHVVLGSQGDVSLPYKATWSAFVLDDTPYRYIRYVKPINFAAVAELRVLAEPVPTPQ